MIEIRQIWTQLWGNALTTAVLSIEVFQFRPLSVTSDGTPECLHTDCCCGNRHRKNTHCWGWGETIVPPAALITVNISQVLLKRWQITKWSLDIKREHEQTQKRAASECRAFHRGLLEQQIKSSGWGEVRLAKVVLSVVWREPLPQCCGAGLLCRIRVKNIRENTK